MNETSARRKHTLLVDAPERVELSEEVISAVPGEFYSYSADFSTERPLYFLMKCKANKSRPLNTDVKHICRELDLTFVFGSEVILCSPDSRCSLGLLRSVGVDSRPLNHTDIRTSLVSKDAFYDCWRQRKESLLIEMYHQASSTTKSDLILHCGLIVSVKTQSGKYGLLLVKEVTDDACSIDGCHILV